MRSDQHYKEALEALITYCNYQERCTIEVRQKLSAFEIDDTKKEQLIEELKITNYLNDERFAEAFISGKVRIKRWGRNKIRAALRSKQISELLIENGFKKVIRSDDYQEQLEKLFTQKWKQLKNKKDITTRAKLFRFLYSKGYESELINQLINQLFSK